MNVHERMRETHEQLLVYVPRDDMIKFREWCINNDIKMSQVIRKHIKEIINDR